MTLEWSGYENVVLPACFDEDENGALELSDGARAQRSFDTVGCGSSLLENVSVLLFASSRHEGTYLNFCSPLRLSSEEGLCR